MSELPEPLTPADCELQDFAFMPLDVNRLRNSELVSDESPEACFAGVLLWCASWHEIPAGSIPDNDGWQAKVAGYKSRGKIDKAWEEVRAGALRGFVKCSDGRLYHEVVAEKANEAWVSKVRHAYDKLADRTRKANRNRLEKGQTLLPIPTLDWWISAGKPAEFPPDAPGIPPESALKGKGQGDGQGQGQGDSDSSVPSGTGAGAPPPPTSAPKSKALDRPKTPAEQEKSLLWWQLKHALVVQGTSKDLAAAGVLLGRAAKQYGEPVFLDAARATVAANPGNTHTFFIELCERAAGKRQPLNRQVALEDANFEAARQFAEGRS